MKMKKNNSIILSLAITLACSAVPHTIIGQESIAPSTISSTEASDESRLYLCLTTKAACEIIRCIVLMAQTGDKRAYAAVANIDLSKIEAYYNVIEKDNTANHPYQQFIKSIYSLLKKIVNLFKKYANQKNKINEFTTEGTKIINFDVVSVLINEHQPPLVSAAQKAGDEQVEKIVNDAVEFVNASHTKWKELRKNGLGLRARIRDAM